MTIEEVCIGIESEEHTECWKQAPPVVKLATIASWIAKLDGYTAETPKAAKKPKQRKKREKKPLTQHAIGGVDEP